MSEARLRIVFDKFDVDKSGAVSTDEMTQMIKSLKLKLTESEIKQLMRDADPDGSGHIEFEEFASVLKKQLKSGKGGLASVVTEASSAWGFLNPLSWFAEEPASSAASAPPSAAPASPAKLKMSTKPGIPKGSASKPSASKAAKATRASPKATPKGRRSSTPKGTPKSGKKAAKAAAAAAVAASSAAHSALELSPSSPHHRMKKTQAAVQEANRHQAAAHRAAAQENKAWWAMQEESFLASQHERVLRGHQQAVERTASIEALKQVKREVGTEMRKEIERKMEEAVD